MTAKLLRELLPSRFTHHVDQHGALFNRSNAPSHRDNNQADRNDNHERSWRMEMVVHEEAEIFKDGGNGGSHSEQQKGGEL
jgi:hypothetical protein